MDAKSEMLPMASGPFAANWESLAKYQAPAWYRDAKFGIWAHWDAQCVPEQGDWYARKMYIQGDHDYAYQLAHYGHPSKVGFKDIDRLWHAERWEPERLIDLYRRAGAKFFMSLANHHDNFDCFDSAYQPWNAVRMGPKRDIVGTWAKAARAAGLRFGVSVHAAHAWSWFEVAQGADKTGPLAGVPYDGKLTAADGKGTWWEGYDPQDLYAQNHVPGKALVWDWDARKGSSIPDAAYCTKFYNRTVDLINKYQPDLIYFDDTVLPLYPISDVGLKLAAHYYNSSIANHGALAGVLTGKGLNESQRRCMVWDMERGWSDRIEPLAWQTDTCIGDWHYSRAIYQQRRYKSAETVIHMLADIVSKNGNLQLSIPVRGDGTIDELEVAFLEEMAAWMAVNGEAIFGTRPWSIYGEGPSTVQSGAVALSGNFNEGKRRPLGAEDVRFTTRGDTLYAIVMGWPSGGTMVLRSLASDSMHYPGDVGAVWLLGMETPLKWQRTAEGLRIELPPAAVGKHAFAFKVAHAG